MAIKNLSTNPVAKHVKIADILHTLSDCPSQEATAKYAAALAYMLEY